MPGSVAPAAPIEIRIWTTQELTLSGNALAVTDALGNRVDNLDAHVDQTDPNRKQLVASLQPLAPGQYTVTYTASSADDGHEFTDSYVFTVGPAAELPAAEPPAAELPPSDPLPAEPSTASS
jgi:methionine-rich copper-binding protein CopC